jgi:hypothetical protein
VYPEARLLPVRTRAFIDAINAHLLAEQRAWQDLEPARSGRVGEARSRRKKK